MNIRKGIVLGTSVLLGAICGGKVVKKMWLEKCREQHKEFIVASYERDILYTCLKLKQQGVRFSEYFIEHSLQSIAVLGMGMEGRYLLDELLNEKQVNVTYGVEADYLGSVHETLTVYRLGEDLLPPADCIVVCDVNQKGKKILAAQKEFLGTVITLEKVLEWLMDRHKIQPWRGQSTSARPAY